MEIYKTTNLVNNKIYIGKNITNNKLYLGSGILLKRAIKKYGASNFVKEIIDTADTIEELNEKEKQWITYYNSQDSNIGYNIACGGDGGDTLSKHPDLDNMRHKFSHDKRKGMSMPKKEKSAKWINLDVEQVIYMYVVENKSLTVIGNVFNTSKNKIARTLVDNNITLRTRQESCKLRKKPSIETKIKMSESHKGSRNGMKGKSLYEVWVNKYGIEIANEKMNSYKEKMSESLKDSGFNKGDKHYTKKTRK